MRTKHELIQHLIDALNRVSYRDRNELDAFKHQAETMIKTLSGNTSEYRYQLQEARFAPWAFEASEEDYQKSWEQGKQSVLNILKTLDMDEKLTLRLSASPVLHPHSVEQIKSSPELTQFPVDVTKNSELTVKTSETPANFSIPQPDLIPNVKDSRSVQASEPLPKDSTEVPLPVNEDLPSTKEILPPVAFRKFFALNGFLKFIFTKIKNFTRARKIITTDFSKNAELSNNDQENSATVAIADSQEKSVAVSSTNNDLLVERSGQESSEKVEVSLADSSPPKEPKLANRILLIHGSDDRMKEKVIEVLNELGLTAVLSFDRENFHKTLAQKMTEFSDVSFVIVLLSFDGHFYGKDQKAKEAKLVSQPNVVFELGFMIGKFGRNKVFVLYDEKKNYELPTAFFNAYYIPYDEDRIWRDELVKVLTNHENTVQIQQSK